MPMLADRTGEAPVVADAYRFVVGVDTHAKFHWYAVVEVGTGRVLDQARFATNAAGLARAADWIARRTGGDLNGVLVSCEGTGTYGARLAKTLLELGYRVVDAPSPKRDRGGSKNDAIDAIKAARSALAKRHDRLADVRDGQFQDALKALLRTVDLGFDARTKLTPAEIRQISRWRTRNEPLAVAIVRAEAIRIAARVGQLHDELRANKIQLRQIVAAQTPALLDVYGAGPVNAAIILAVPPRPGPQRSSPGPDRRRLPD